MSQGQFPAYSIMGLEEKVRGIVDGVSALTTWLVEVDMHFQPWSGVLGF